MIYDKSPITIEEQISKLQNRGMIFNDVSLAHRALSHISYYRMVGYWWPMYEDKENHIFKPNTVFEDVVALYNFDHELRILLFDMIEKIEISLRTKLIYHLSHEFDPWWFQNTDLFQDSLSLIKTLSSIQEEVERSKDTFIKEHNRKYKDDKRFPPAWKTLEMTSFGSLSKLYGNLKNNIKSKDAIAEDYGAVNHTYLPSWLQSMAQIRNYCAHHSRLWNKNLPGAPKLLPKPPNPWLSEVPKQHEFQKLYIHMCLMKYMLNVIQPNNRFTERLALLMSEYRSVDPNALGFKVGWEEEPLWRRL
ncbi:abortive infection bacteriophage resistance protein [Roseivirga ehrenbergii]|uniref:Abi family protein n=1 Tax=Roseivirga ehrenbergii (strain DSM 102268 / JCM 13514 / KCTC 12282 / NCIMB 14502 / KMM 6017) TaxID=279360 RepID=UPI000AB9A99B|nr:Abi family protein [Roseivirga ehrenbergii]TCK99591.1 abortive infection bacteriophage resistance protein [Roseivirga ehrenbergii]